VASYLEARSRSGQWLVRIEDIDPPREQPGSAELILNALEAYGFEWDGAASYQSANRDAQDAAVAQLIEAQQAYPCGCSRRDLADVAEGPLGAIYPGTCRTGFNGSEYAIRVRTNDTPIHFDDHLQGRQTQRLQAESGDFIIRRRDGLIAYQLAVVVDDYLQGITEVVRGVDLLDSTPRQIWLQRLLGYPTPAYVHIPVAVNADGQKLSKNTGAPAIPVDDAGTTLVMALEALEQQPPSQLRFEPQEEIWAWALKNWSIKRLEERRTVDVAKFTMAEAKNGLR